MEERKKHLKTQEIINELSNLARKYQLKIDSKRYTSTLDFAWDFETHAGAILVKAFRLKHFENDGRLNRIFSSFDSINESKIDYRMIFIKICEKYLTNKETGFDFEMKRHQVGLEKALILAVKWFENYLIKINEKEFIKS